MFLFMAGDTKRSAGAVFDPLTVSSGKVYFNAQNPLNTLDTVSESFATTAVDTATDKITLSTTGFVRVSNDQFGLCYFTTTGTLPAGLSLSTLYIPENNGDGTFSFYPVASNANYADFAGYENGETLLSGYYYMFQTGKINLTDQGSGTHTMHTYPMVNKIQNIFTNTDLFTQNTRASMFEIRNDSYGDYIALQGEIALSDDYVEPAGKLLTDNLSATALGDLFDGKRYLYSISVMRPRNRAFISKARAICKPANVNAGTGVFTAASHALTTGQVVTPNVLSTGGAFPTPTVAFAGTIYARAVSSSTVTLHPSSADASANTNKYVFSDTGTRIFSITGTTTLRSGIAYKKFLFDLNMQSNDHTFTPMTYAAKKQVTLSSSGFFLSGANDGKIGGVLDVADFGDTAQSTHEVEVFIPSGSTAPVCDDTGVPFTSGTYWLTLEPTNKAYCRMHRTLANAQASVGITASSLANTVCMKYGTLGVGSASFYFPKNYLDYRNHDDLFPNGASYSGLAIPDQLGVYVTINDYLDGSGTVKFSSGVNSENSFLNNLASSRSSPIPAQSASTSLILGNAAQNHVSGYFDVYEVFLGATDTDPSADIQYLINGFMSKWGI